MSERVAIAIALAIGLLASSTAHAQATEPEALHEVEPAPQWPASDATRVRLTAGVNGAPLVNHAGFHLQLASAVWSWELGELVVGAQLATHFYNPSQPAQPGVDLGAFDASLRLHAVLGHVFTLASRQLELGAYLLSGPSLRIIESHLRDPAHGIGVDRSAVEPLFEVSAMVGVGWRMMEGLGVSVSLAVPLWVSGSDDVMEGWLAVPPFVGASVTGYL